MWKFIKEFFGFFDNKETEMPKKDTRSEDITTLYRTVLGREPDKEGLDWWVNTPATIEEIKTEFLKSPEYVTKDRTEKITAIYKDVLGRDPDADGLKYWVETTATIDEIKVSFMQSEEYLSKITPTPAPVQAPVVEAEKPKAEPKPATKATAKPVSKGRPKKTK